MISVYLSGPIGGCTDEEVFGWRNRMKALLPRYNVIDPTVRDMRGKVMTREDDKYVIEKDKAEIRQSRYLVVNPWKATFGTPMEVIYAYDVCNGCCVISVIPPGCPGDHPWIRYHSNVHVETLEEAAEMIKHMDRHLEDSHYN